MDFKDLHIPRFNELPDFGLYNDQVVVYLNKLMFNITGAEDNYITTSMINNYVKQKIISPSINKKYNNEHIAYLLCIVIFKQIYSINEIEEMIKIQLNTSTAEVAYNYLCVELEKALKEVFNNEENNDSSITHKEERNYIRMSVIAFAKILYVKNMLKNERKTNLK